MTLKGHCLCKAVTYTADVDAPLITGYDHCDDCQRQTGSTYCKFIPSSIRIPPLVSLRSCDSKFSGAPVHTPIRLGGTPQFNVTSPP